jgi:hypothetical protein
MAPKPAGNITVQRILDDIRLNTATTAGPKQVTSGSDQELLQAIKADIVQASASAPPAGILEQIQMARHHQRGLYDSPVIGERAWLKKITYRLTFFIFHRLYWINDHLMTALEQLYAAIESERQQRSHQLDQIGVQLDRLVALMTQETAALPNNDGDTTAALQSPLARDERAVLYGLVSGLKPGYVLEVSNGEAVGREVISRALEDNRFGQLVSVEISLQQAPHWIQLNPHIRQVRGDLAGVFGVLQETVGATFDLVLLSIVANDAAEAQGYLEYCAGLLSSSAYVLVHHCNYPTVHEAVAQFVSDHPERFTECGILTPYSQHPSMIGGIKLLYAHTQR